MEQKPNKEDTIQILCHFNHGKQLEYNNWRFQTKVEDGTSQVKKQNPPLPEENG